MGVAAPNGISGLQCRMARAGLRWNLRDLEQHAKVSRMTIVRFEGEVAKTTSANIAALRRAFEAAGVEFVENYGVHIRKPPEAR